MTDASNLLLRGIPRDPGYSRELDPESGSLIASPFSTHTHVYIRFPFEVTEIFVKDVILSDHYEIRHFPSYQQPAVQAGQDIVVKEMAKLKHEIRHIRINQALPLVTYNLINRTLVSVTDREFWRAELGWSGATKPEKTVQTRNYAALQGLRSTALNDKANVLVWDHCSGEWISKGKQTAIIKERIVSELERIDELRYKVEEEFNAGIHRTEQEGEDLAAGATQS